MSKFIYWIANLRWLGIVSFLSWLVIGFNYLLIKTTGETIISELLASLPSWVIEPWLGIVFFVISAPSLQKYFPVLKYESPEPESIRELLFGVNSRALDLCKALANKTMTLENISSRFDLKRELFAVTTALAKHIIASNEAIDRPRDIFITVYILDPGQQTLKYLHHYPPSRDGVKSYTISLQDKKYEDYECVKSLSTSGAGAVIFDKNKYKKTTSNRYKTLEHYIGLKLEIGEEVFGFVNIEFHSKGAFADEKQMMLFYEEEINVFKLFYEYQFLQLRLFKKIECAQEVEVK